MLVEQFVPIPMAQGRGWVLTHQAEVLVDSSP